MKVEEVRQIMKRYGSAWEKRDTELLLSCFTPNGVYWDTPLKKPARGHKEIRKYWEFSVVENTKNVKFKLGKCFVSDDGKTGFAEWVCDNSYRSLKDRKWRNGKMAGIMILRMKDGKISYLNEYYNSTRNVRNSE